MRIIHATDILTRLGPARNIQALDLMRRLYGEPETDLFGRSFWQVEDQDVQYLWNRLRDKSLSQER